MPIRKTEVETEGILTQVKTISEFSSDHSEWKIATVVFNTK